LVVSAGDVKLILGYDQGVMSGIITYALRLRELIFRGIYFKDYFNQPSRAEIGTMVAILEVGAFCMTPLISLQL
jgi:hypothetical protein